MHRYQIGRNRPIADTFYFVRLSLVEFHAARTADGMKSREKKSSVPHLPIMRTSKIYEAGEIEASPTGAVW